MGEVPVGRLRDTSWSLGAPGPSTRATDAVADPSGPTGGQPQWQGREGSLATVVPSVAGSPRHCPDRNAQDGSCSHSGFAARELSVCAPSKTNASSGWPPGPLFITI